MNRTCKRLVSVSLVAVMAISLAACNRTATPDTTSRTQNYRVNQHQPNTVTPHYYNGMNQSTTPGPSTQLYGREKAVADRMVREAMKIPAVAYATAVVNGQDAVIGIDINTDNKRNAVAIEHKVAAAVKKAEPRYNVHVTANRLIHEQIRTLHTQMQGEHPVRTLTNDVKVIIRDIDRSIRLPLY